LRAEAKAAAKEEAERIKAELIEQDAKAKAQAEKELNHEAKKGKGKKNHKKEEAAPAKQETPKPV